MAMFKSYISLPEGTDLFEKKCVPKFADLGNHVPHSNLNMWLLFPCEQGDDLALRQSNMTGNSPKIMGSIWFHDLWRFSSLVKSWDFSRHL